MKLASTALAAVIATTSMSLTAFADHTVVISHDDDAGEVTATSYVSGVSRMALAQFDVYGRMINFTVGAENSATVTNAFSYAPEYKTKVMSFSNFDTATAVEEVRTLGSKTLFLWDGETYSNTNGTYIYNGQSIDPWSQTGKWTGTSSDDSIIGTDFVFEYGNEIHCKLNDADSMTDASGNTYNGAWFNLASGNVSSEWVVFEWDMTINTNQATQSDESVSAFTINMSEGTSETDAYIPLAHYRFDRNRTGWFLSYKYDPQLEVAYLSGDSNSGISGTQTSSDGTATYLRYSYLGDYGNVKGYGSDYTYHMTVLMNYRDEMLEFYVDGVRQGVLDWTDSAEEQYLSDGNFVPNAIRFAFSGNKFDVSFDNLHCYEGSESRTDIATELVKEIVISDKAVTMDKFADRYEDSIYVNQLGSYKTVHANTGVVWNGSEKVILNNTPYESESGAQMVPKDELATALGISCGSTSGSETKNGVTYVPITSFLSGQTYTHLATAPDNANGYVIGTTSFAPSDVDLFNDWMMYYRPTADTVMADYKNSARYYQHPRLLATSADFDALRERYEEYLLIDDDFDTTTGYTPALDEPWNRWLRNFMQYANQMIGEAWTPVYEAYDSAGRMNWQRRFASEMYAFGMAYQLTQDTKYIDAAWREIEVVCSDEFPDFNLTHRLDTSEAMAAFAIAYDWMYHGFTADQRAAMEKCMHDKGLYHAWSGYTTYTGMALEFFAGYNHAVVGNNGAAMLAMSLLDVYPEASAWVLSEAIKAQDRNIQLWNNEAWPEGVGYWELTMQHTSKFIESLDGIFPGGYGFKGLEGLNRAGVAQAQHHTPLGNFNYSDAGETSKYWVPELVWLANTYDEPGLAQLVADNRPTGFTQDRSWEGEDRALAVLWYDDSQTSELDTDYINTKIDVATLRDVHTSDATADYTFVGIKGGTPTDGHAHIDTGSFVFEADGIRWARDLGSGTYTGSNYFDYEDITGNRWLHISARGEAHNTLINNPVSTKGDMNIFTTADLNLVDSNDSGAIVTVDMSNAMFDVSAAKRGFFYTDNRESLVIRDEVTPSAASSMYWTMMLPTGCTITDNGNGSFTITSGEETLLVEYAISGATLGTVTAQGSNFTSIFESSGNILDLTTTSNGQVVRKFSSGKLQLPITASSGANVTITVKLTPGSVSSPSALATYNKAIANWSL